MMQRDAFKRIILRLAKYCGLFFLARLLTRGQLAILGYHGIWYTGAHYGNALFMTADKFRKRMDWLKKSGYVVLELEEALHRMYNKTLPARAVVLTIDDGWYGTGKYMLPILRERGLPATLYVCTGPVENQLPEFNVLLRIVLERTHLSECTLRIGPTSTPVHFDLRSAEKRDQACDQLIRIIRGLNDMEKLSVVEQLSEVANVPVQDLLESRQLHFMAYSDLADAERQGIDIQLHTHSHLLDLKRPSSVTEEIAVNRLKLKLCVTKPLRHFCYPGGHFSPEMFPCLEVMEIASATSTQTGLNTRATNKYALRRILDGERVSELEMEAELAGFIEITRRMKHVVYANRYWP